MPPKKKSRPDPKMLEAFVSTLDKQLHAMDTERQTTQGRTSARRLTRVEFENSMHQLLGVHIPLVDYLPEDETASGFDTVAEGQQMSHHHLSYYLEAIDAAVDTAEMTDLEADPVPGTGRFYLLRATNLCGTGDFGSTTSGDERLPGYVCD